MQLLVDYVAAAQSRLMWTHAAHASLPIHPHPYYANVLAQAVTATTSNSPTNLSNHHHSVTAMVNTTTNTITAHNSSRLSSPPPRSQPPAENQYDALELRHPSNPRKRSSVEDGDFERKRFRSNQASPVYENHTGYPKKRSAVDDDSDWERKRIRLTQAPPVYELDADEQERRKNQRSRSRSIEGQENAQLLKKMCASAPVIRSNHTEVERCSP